MVRTFDIEEIFPDVPVASVRLPRRQANSPQGLAVTLVADYTMDNRAWLPSAAIVALLGEFGVTSGAARTAISRLARRGVLEGSRRGRHSSYRLTRPAAVNLSAGGAEIAAFAADRESWDGRWTIVAFSMPKEESAQRRALRDDLRWRGYAPLYDGVWVSPRPMTAAARAVLAAVAFGTTSVFRARHLELDTGASRSPVDAWDVAGISAQYRAFIRRWSPLLRRMTAGGVTGAEAVRARTEMMDTYRRFPVLDPLLPVELMPSGWPRARARELFVAVYDGLAEPAQEHIRAVAAHVAGGEQHSRIRAHTVAELRAGALRSTVDVAGA
ncbi:PaaX family transcriptional regulator C-terminal domain-containing protein [Micromonospora sp. KC723]|uniref:PaaX family transcriptional regulator n=1 Tax=Micromonospora sp. KC723 TaxID=2530381 RepID=UPI001052DBDB|nr:PaaX family transcriptional regulator C-terminal domain-containing protein [Micromonospora sp. KC723]TDB78073.1 PaaX family transcriptional regulator [Micromonospora sp. KC723]